MARTQITLLQQLMRLRNLTHADTIRLLEQRARQMSISDFTLGERTLDNWLAGGLKTMPQPVRRRVIEAEFQYPITELLSFVDDDSAPVDEPGEQPSLDPAQVLSAAASRSARFALRAEAHTVSDDALESLRLRLGQLASGYVHTAMWPIFNDLTALRDDLFDLLDAPHPARARDLYGLAAMTCGMLAHASGNLGHPSEAGLQAQAALICARKADRPALAGWALGIRALQAEWHGRPAEALRLLARAHLELAGRQPGGTLPSWLAAIEARAYASLGQRTEAVGALERTGELRLAAGAVGNELDEIGGILTFPDAKRLFYTASTYRRLGEMAETEARATAAITAYAEGPLDQRSYGDETLAWIDLAIARVARSDLDGAAEAVDVIARLPKDRRLPPLLRPLADLQNSIAAARGRDSGQAVLIRGMIGDLVMSFRRQVSDAGA